MEIQQYTPPQPAGAVALFLDVDGTLLDFAPTPAAVRVDAELLALLASLGEALAGAVALVSGRRIADLDALFAPLRLPAAGVHGCELRDARGAYSSRLAREPRLAALRDRLADLVMGTPGLLLEDKGGALALHFRRAPWLGESLRARLAELAGPLLGDYELLRGDAVVELKPRAASKGAAVEALLASAPFAGRLPLFLGDDETDRHGFAAVEQHGGMAIAVGRRVPARWWLADPAAARSWLGGLLAAQRSA